MKTKTNPASSIDEVLDGQGAIIVPTIQKLTYAWVSKMQGKFEDNGENDNSNELAQVALRVIDNFDNKPFSSSDFILSATYLDLPIETVTKFFNGWISFLGKSKRVQVTRAQDSVYDWDSYFFVK